MNILLLHGWLLERSGSNVYTASLAREWLAAGHTVHLFCQERHPEHYDFINQGIVYDLEGNPQVTYGQPGPCTLHRPEIGDLLPVFNLDTYEGFTVVKRFVDMTAEEIERYLAINVRALLRLGRDHKVEVAFANHVFPNPTLLERVKTETGLPFVVFPHGSCIEYAVKRSQSIREMTRQALDACDRLIVGNQVVTDRIWAVYPERAERWRQKHAIVSVGVDTSLFCPLPREQRSGTIGQLALGEGTGKTPAQTLELFEKARHLDSDEGLLALVRAARGQYHYTSPDADLANKFAQVDWQADKIVLYVGKLIAGKGVHDLLLALPEVLSQNPRVRLILVGESTYREALEILLMALSEGRGWLVESIVRQGWALDERPAEELTAARAYLDKVGLQQVLEWGQQTRPLDRVIFTGYLNHSRFRHVLPCADVTIFPSEIAEAYPLVLLESICAGVLPMVAYFEGLKDGIDAISRGLPAELQEDLRISVDPSLKLAEIASKLPRVLAIQQDYSGYCREMAESTYSWMAVAASLAEEMARALP